MIGQCGKTSCRGDSGPRREISCWSDTTLCERGSTGSGLHALYKALGWDLNVMKRVKDNQHGFQSIYTPPPPSQPKWTWVNNVSEASSLRTQLGHSQGKTVQEDVGIFASQAKEIVSIHLEVSSTQ